MKEPKLSQLRIDTRETARIRADMKGRKSVKITINIDTDSLITLKKMALETGVPYQRLLNNLLRDNIARKSETQSRLDKLEKELDKVKRKLAA